MNMLAERTGFKITNVFYDSSFFQFYASVQYCQDIPLRDKRSYYENSRNSIFSKQDILEFTLKAEELNQNNDGDQACFYLRKI